MVILTRTHYSIDVLDGILAGWFSISVAERLSPKCEELLGVIANAVFPQFSSLKEKMTTEFKDDHILCS